MKTNEELNALKEEIEALNNKLAELNEEELAQVSAALSSLPPATAGTSMNRLSRRPSSAAVMSRNG